MEKIDYEKYLEAKNIVEKFEDDLVTAFNNGVTCYILSDSESNKPVFVTTTKGFAEQQYSKGGYYIEGSILLNPPSLDSAMKSEIKKLIVEYESKICDLENLIYDHTNTIEKELFFRYVGEITIYKSVIKNLNKKLK